jgi:5-methylcytosine-specific restriction endonuclease McrA
MMRREALLVYGDGSCAECGSRPEDVAELELDHVNGGGNEHRLTVLGHSGAAGRRFSRWLKINGWPTDPPLQTLCVVCHREKSNQENTQRGRSAA